jgi:hypothetical protein
MSRALVLLSLLSLGCAARGGVAPDSIASGAVGAAGDIIDAAPAPGETFATDLVTIDGETVAVPDPDGRVVVLELIRSADW